MKVDLLRKRSSCSQNFFVHAFCDLQNKVCGDDAHRTAYVESDCIIAKLNAQDGGPEGSDCSANLMARENPAVNDAGSFWSKDCAAEHDCWWNSRNPIKPIEDNKDQG